MEGVGRKLQLRHSSLEEVLPGCVQLAVNTHIGWSPIRIGDQVRGIVKASQLPISRGLHPCVDEGFIAATNIKLAGKVSVPAWADVF